MSSENQLPPVPEQSADARPAKRVPAIGIGASAGGIRALQELFESLPEYVPAAFVVIVHLDPGRQSELPNILAAHTKMPVDQVTSRVRLEPGHVYVIPPNRQLLILDQHLSAVEFAEPRWRRAPIDLFFRSLAAQKGGDFAVVLSGAGSDGSIGAKAVKEAGGIILVQHPKEAEHASMPSSVIATGVADFVLPVREIAERLPELVAASGAAATEQVAESDEETLQLILSYIRVHTGHDFSQYKKSMVQRRIARRMQVHRTPTLAAYLSILRDNAGEPQALFGDLLISVTSFFRDAAAFKTLADSVIPRLFEEKGAGDAVRVWIPGCATGEEAYTIAILLMEERDRRDVHPKIQVFASDIDETALPIAREGRYPQPIEADVSEERLRRFFTPEDDGHYRVRSELRDIVTFSKHSLLKDPPFSRLDLISCRNLLIYLGRDRRQQVCLTFHFALLPSGYLMLGSSETADNPTGLFRVVDRDARIFQRAPSEANAAMVAQALMVGGLPEQVKPPTGFSVRTPHEETMHREALERTAPPSAVVDEAFRVVHLSETAGCYMRPSAGPLANDITELAREELRSGLRSALHRVFAHGEAILSPPIAISFDGAQRRVYLQVKLLRGEPRATRTAIVFFFEGEAHGEDLAKTPELEMRASSEQIRELQQELQFTLSRLRTSREEYEGANEELRAANEELQSINEEYCSTAEELETSKEELQSINEELQTVNSELKSKLDSISSAHSDIQNLMAATDVGILFLDNQLRIRRFTPRVVDLFSIAAGDEGRLITDFTSSLNYEAFAADARQVLETLALTEREVCSRNDAWYLMRLRPYRTVENRVDGIVVTFVDISERRHAEQAQRDSEARIRAIIDGVADSIVTIDEAGLIQAVNKSSDTMFGYSTEELLGANVSMLMPEPQRAKHDGYIRNYLETGVAKVIGLGREVEALRKDGSTFPAEIRVTEIRHLDKRLFIGFVRDLSERRMMERRLRRLHGDRLSSMAEMASALAHELNQPLAAAANYLQAALRLLEPFPQRPPAVNEALNNASSQMLRAGRIVGHLHQFISRGDSERTMENLHAIIKHTCELASPLIKEANVNLILRLEAPEDWIVADKVQIQQVLVNLIRNACEAMSPSTVRDLTITTTLKDEKLQTDVLDTGAGLSKSVDADFFEPFATTKSSGLGVGLSIARSIIESHGGKIWADRGSGGGARFSFFLPLATANVAEE